MSGSPLFFGEGAEDEVPYGNTFTTSCEAWAGL